MKDCHLWVMVALFCALAFISAAKSTKIRALKNNSNDAICQKYFGTNSLTASSELAKIVNHKRVKPNTIIVKCGDK